MLQRHRQLLRTVLFGLMVLLLSAPAPLLAATEQSNTLLDETLRLYESGDYSAALPQLLFLLETANEDTPMIEARLAVSRIYLQKRQIDAALAQISQIPATQRNDQTRLLEGQILLAAGLFDESVATLKRVDENSLTTAEQAALLTALAQGSAGRGELFPALWFVHRALQVAVEPEQETKAFGLATELLAAEETAPQLSEIAFMFAGKPIGAAAAVLQVERTLASGDEALARARIAQIDIGLIPGPFRKPAITLYTELTGENWLQRSVGVILPLSGKYSVYGDFVRRGMELALDAAVNQTGVRFLFYDGGADPGKSREAVRSLVRGEKVVAVTGAITGAAAEAIAEQSQSERVPLLTLSQRDGLPETGSFVFRNALTARQQAETLARYAVLNQGLTSFGVLYPENRLGQNMAELFTEEVENNYSIQVTEKVKGILSNGKLLLESVEVKALQNGREISYLPNTFETHRITETQIIGSTYDSEDVCGVFVLERKV